MHPPNYHYFLKIGVEICLQKKNEYGLTMEFFFY